jgi:hypothetical protein
VKTAASSRPEIPVRATPGGLARLLEVALDVGPEAVESVVRFSGVDSEEPAPALPPVLVLSLGALSGLGRVIVRPLSRTPPLAKPITQSHYKANLPPGEFHIKPLVGLC